MSFRGSSENSVTWTLNSPPIKSTQTFENKTQDQLADRFCSSQPDISSSTLSNSNSKSTKRSISSKGTTDKEPNSSTTSESSKKRPRHNTNETVNDTTNSPPLDQIQDPSRLTEKNINALQETLLGLTPGKKHARISDGINRESQHVSIGDIVGRGAQKTVFNLTDNCVFLSSHIPLQQSARVYGIHSTTPNKTHGLAEKGIDGVYASNLPPSSQIKVLSLLTKDLRRFHREEKKCHMDLKPENFCFTLDQATHEVTKAHWIDHDSAKGITSPLKNCTGTPEYSSPEVTKQYEKLHTENLNFLNNFSEIDFHKDTILGAQLLNQIPFFKELFPQITTSSHTCKSAKIIELRSLYQSNKSFKRDNPSDVTDTPVFELYLNLIEDQLNINLPSSNISTNIDMWALGCTIIRLAAGKSLHTFYPGEIANGRKIFNVFKQILKGQGLNEQYFILGAYKLYNKMFHIFHTTATPETLTQVKRSVFSYVNNEQLSTDLKNYKFKLLEIAFKCLEKDPGKCIYLDTVFEELNILAEELKPGSETTDEDSLFSADDKEIYEPTQITDDDSGSLSVSSTSDDAR